MENRKIILILLVIIAVLAVALGAVFLEISKQDTKLAISHKTINVGDSLVVVLADEHGNPISNETVKIKITDKNGQAKEKDVKTNSKGKAKLKVEQEGKYSVLATFNGNVNHAASSLSDNIDVEKPSTELVSEDKSSFDGNVYNKYSSKIGSYRVVENQQELAVIESANGNYYVMGGDGIYTYNGRDSRGAIQLGSPV